MESAFKNIPKPGVPLTVVDPSAAVLIVTNLIEFRGLAQEPPQEAVNFANKVDQVIVCVLPNSVAVL